MTQLTAHSALCYLLAMTAVAVTGCSKDSPSLATVKGQVTLDGQALTSGTVVTSTDDGRGARGAIDAQGRFTLSSGKLGEGAQPGLHHVAVKAYSSSDPGNPEAAAKPLVPQRYLSTANSGLTIDVKAGELNEVTLELSSHPNRNR